MGSPSFGRGDGRRAPPSFLERGCIRLGGGWRLQGQLKGETGAAARAGLDLDGALVAIDDLLDDGQPKPRAHLAAGLGLFRTKELLEQVLHVFFGNANARILHCTPEHLAIALQLDRDPATLGLSLIHI